jgi:hypothetical protein
MVTSEGIHSCERATPLTMRAARRTSCIRCRSAAARDASALPEDFRGIRSNNSHHECGFEYNSLRASGGRLGVKPASSGWPGLGALWWWWGSGVRVAWRGVQWCVCVVRRGRWAGWTRSCESARRCAAGQTLALQLLKQSIGARSTLGQRNEVVRHIALRKSCRQAAAPSFVGHWRRVAYLEILDTYLRATCRAPSLVTPPASGLQLFVCFHHRLYSVLGLRTSGHQ